MMAYGHGELNTKKFTDIEYIKHRIDNHKDIFSENSLQKVKLDETFPEYIIKNKDRFFKFMA